ncbi:hypothetical protein CYMTET_23617 [Cymbomonas tetramitiformis]|uniref:Right handed beta helix domain-containing protein n=1 Tax=Cymbomonas tetramitiformis TaxID=36881 RepID=A0AAE0FXX9_9CHLO|nr:hypothetical protein CYMTET_23617 [Cymbomonas tetramitiformis]
MDGLCEVDGGQQGPLFSILGGGALLLERLSLTNFYNTNGGVITSVGTLVINACNMSRNHASESGGVLHATNGGRVTIINSIMTHNTATDYGGVAYIGSSDDDGHDYDDEIYSGDVSISECTITENTAWDGGVAYIKSSGNVSISECTMTGNTAARLVGMSVRGNAKRRNENLLGHGDGAMVSQNGGVAYIATSDDVSSNRYTAYEDYGGVGYSDLVSISECTMTENTALYGGVAYIYSRGKVSISECTMTRNTAAEDGGVASISSTVDVSISECTMTGNTATGSSGGVASISYSGDVSISECNMTGNTAYENGGVAYIERCSGDVSISECTMTGNTAAQVGGAL